MTIIFSNLEQRNIRGEGFEIIVTAQMWLNSQAFEILGYCPYDKIPDADKAE